MWERRTDSSVRSAFTVIIYPLRVPGRGRDWVRDTIFIHIYIYIYIYIMNIHVVDVHFSSSIIYHSCLRIGASKKKTSIALHNLGGCFESII